MSSDRDRRSRGPTAAERFSVAILVLLLVGAGSAFGWPGDASQEYRLGGEYGLWVTNSVGRVRVAWLTTDAKPGFLNVFRDGELIHQATTELSQGHHSSFERPSDGPLVLEYGGLGDPTDQHRTVIHLESEIPPAPSVVTGVDSLFVVGDVHGEFERTVRLLHAAGLVDRSGHWTGSGAHLVFTGDLFDRGDDVLRTLWYLYHLEREAAGAGGAVHVLLGNHETMVMTSDLRYVSPKESLIAFLHQTEYPRLFDLRSSILGRWLASKGGMLRVDDVLLAHGGVAPAWAGYSVGAFNDSLRAFLSEDLFYYWADTTVVVVTDSAVAARIPARRVIVMDSAAFERRSEFFFSEDNVFWFRGYVGSDTFGPALQDVLDRHGATVHVVGHSTVAPIQERYGGRLIAVDLQEAASEMLLMVRDGDRWRRYRYTTDGLAGRLPRGSAATPVVDPVYADTPSVGGGGGREG